MSAETINMRTDSERKSKLQVAAALTDRSLTSFILSAAEAAADEVLADHLITTLPADFFDDCFNSVSAEPAPALVDAGDRLPDVVRRG